MIALTSLACASLNVSSHVERNFDLGRFHSWDWGPPDALPAGDPRLDKDPFFQDYLEGAVEKRLAAKGLERVVDGSSDLTVHYHACVTRRIDIDRIDRDYGYCYNDACDPPIVEYEAGTVIVDLIDAKTNRLVWRGWAQGRLDQFLTSHDRMVRHINQAVAGMFDRFPSR